MPAKKNQDLITDQEIAFARLVMAGNVSDQRAAEQVGFKSSVAAYIKAKPRVVAFMQQHRATTQQQLVEHEADRLRSQTLLRARVLARLWQIADIDPESTRNGVSGQVKAIAMIVAIEGLIPSRGGVSPNAVEKESAALPRAEIYQAAWRREQNDALAKQSTGHRDDPEVHAAGTRDNARFEAVIAENIQNHQRL